MAAALRKWIVDSAYTLDDGRLKDAGCIYVVQAGWVRDKQPNVWFPFFLPTLAPYDPRSASPADISAVISSTDAKSGTV